METYIWALYAFERFYQNICNEISVSDFSLIYERLGYIKNDLQTLKCNTNPLPDCVFFQYRMQQDYLLGVKYVIIGSALGGSLISKNINKKLHLQETTGNSFFASNAKIAARQWKSFLQSLENDCKNKNICLAGALGTFQSLEKWLWNADDCKNRKKANNT